MPGQMMAEKIIEALRDDLFSILKESVERENLVATLKAANKEKDIFIASMIEDAWGERQELIQLRRQAKAWGLRRGWPDSEPPEKSG